MAEALNARSRLLRIYFIGEARYQGDLTKDTPWSGRVAWANQLKPEQRKQVLEHLKLPEGTGPAQWWLTEFEDNWAYQAAPGDVYFSPDANQIVVKRPPIIEYVWAPGPVDVTVLAIAALFVLPPVIRRVKWRRQPSAMN